MKRVKKIFGVALFFVLLISVTGCTKENTVKDPDAPAGLKEITGEVSKVELDDDGDIIISKE